MTAESAQTTRRTPCFIESFVEATSDLGIPAPFVKWAGIYAVAAALGRHVWGIDKKGIFYPNLFILLVAPPGSGKTQTEDLLQPFFIDLSFRIAPQHITKAAMMDEMRDCEVRRTDPETGKSLDYHHLLILSSEFSETFPGYDQHTLASLARWWDCPGLVAERKRHLGDKVVHITKACCNMLTGTPPGNLSTHFPLAAWEGGFLARTIFVYVAEPTDLHIWETGEGDKEVFGKRLDEETFTMLKTELETITLMFGEMEVAPSIKQEYKRWKETDQQMPRPTHPRLLYYNVRREHQLVKLSLISAASRGSMVLEAQDYIRARAWLEGTEANLDDIFLEMALTDDLALMKDLNRHLWVTGRGQPIGESTAWRFLTGKVPAERIGSFLEAAAQAKYIEFQHISTGTHRLVKPMDIDQIGVGED